MAAVALAVPPHNNRCVVAKRRGAKAAARFHRRRARCCERTYPTQRPLKVEPPQIPLLRRSFTERGAKVTAEREHRRSTLHLCYRHRVVVSRLREAWEPSPDTTPPHKMQTNVRFQSLHVHTLSDWKTHYILDEL